MNSCIIQGKEFEEDNIKIFIGSQSDRKFLREIKESIPKIDILIDDGGHTMHQQIVSYEELFNHVKDDGVYLCEDLHTSYWLRYGGGYKRRKTFIEYSKRFIDYLNAFHSKQRSYKVNSFTRSVNSIHYYDSILVIEKRTKEEPSHEKTGKISFEDSEKRTLTKKIVQKVIDVTLSIINKALRLFRLPGFIWH